MKRNSTLFEKISRKRKDNTIIIGSTRNIFDFELVKSLIEFDKLNLGISFDVITASAATLNDYLNKGDLDILIDYYTQINLDNRRLKTDIIGNFKTCFACNSKLYEDYKSCFKSLKNMKQFEFVLPSIASRRRQALDIFLNKDEIKLKEKHSMPDSIGMANFIEHTNYIGYFLEDELKFSNLKKINIPEDLPVNSFVAIYSNDANKYVKLFVNILKNCSRY